VSLVEVIAFAAGTASSVLSPREYGNESNKNKCDEGDDDEVDGLTWTSTASASPEKPLQLPLALLSFFGYCNCG